MFYCVDANNFLFFEYWCLNIIELEIIPTSIRIPVLQLFLVYAKKVKVVSDSSLDFPEKLTKEKDIEGVSFIVLVMDMISEVSWDVERTLGNRRNQNLSDWSNDWSSHGYACNWNYKVYGINNKEKSWVCFVWWNSKFPECITIKSNMFRGLLKSRDIRKDLWYYHGKLVKLKRCINRLISKWVVGTLITDMEVQILWSFAHVLIYIMEK